MTKHGQQTSRGGGGRDQPQHYRIGFSDLEPIWNGDEAKYRVLCRSTHVTKATLLIGYVQLGFAIGASLVIGYYNLKMLKKKDAWIDVDRIPNPTQLMVAIFLKMCLLIALIHGVNKERKSFLVPYIIAGFVALFANIIYTLTYLDIYGPKSEFVSRLVGTLLHAWCLSVVWRCYRYLGDKKVAQQIRGRLNANAFNHMAGVAGTAGYSPMSQPPPYTDTVLNTTAAGPSPPPFVVVGLKGGEKQQEAEK